MQLDRLRGEGLAQRGHGCPQVARREVGIPEGHLDRLVTQDLPDGHNVYADHCHVRSSRMPEIVEMKITNPRLAVSRVKCVPQDTEDTGEPITGG